MDDILITMLTAFATAAVTGLITFLIQERRLSKELGRVREIYKTEYMAEQTAKVFLNHEKHRNRSFDVLKKHLGGFEDDELRKILVRAGAIRNYRKEDDAEMWTLLERSQEYHKNLRQQKSQTQS
jgi:hypothetical protein